MSSGAVYLRKILFVFAELGILESVMLHVSITSCMCTYVLVTYWLFLFIFFKQRVNESDSILKCNLFFDRGHSAGLQHWLGIFNDVPAKGSELKNTYFSFHEKLKIVVYL